MDWVRVYTGLTVVLIAVIFIRIGGFVFSLSVAVLVVVALWEFYRVIIRDLVNLNNFIICVSGLLHSFALILVTNVYGPACVPLVLSSNTVIIAFLTIFMFDSNSNIPVIVTKQLAGLLYIPVPLSFLIVIRNGDFGLLWSLMVLCIVAASDIGAYYFGYFFGHHKLCPRISPKKTLEGSLGGLFCSVVAMAIFKLYLFSSFSIFYCTLFAVSVSVVAQIGDLFASEFKRMAGVKDFSGLLPGHGGFLDRIDALVLALPLAYLFRFFIIP